MTSDGTSAVSFLWWNGFGRHTPSLPSFEPAAQWINLRKTACFQLSCHTGTWLFAASSAVCKSARSRGSFAMDSSNFFTGT